MAALTTNRADQAVAQLFASNVMDLEPGENLFTTGLREDVSGLQVACILEGGLPPRVCHVGTPNPTDYRPTVQVLVRSDKGATNDGLDLTIVLMSLIHLAAPVDDPYSPLFGYMDARVVESRPNDLGQLNDGQHAWSFNVDLEFEG